MIPPTEPRRRPGQLMLGDETHDVWSEIPVHTKQTLPEKMPMNIAFQPGSYDNTVWRLSATSPKQSMLLLSALGLGSASQGIAKDWL